MCPNETTKAEIWKLREEQREAGKKKEFTRDFTNHTDHGNVKTFRAKREGALLP